MNLRTALALAAVCAGLPVVAQDRPAEADLFGAPPPAATGEVAPTPASPSPPAEPSPEPGRDDAILGGGAHGPPTGVMSAAQENPLAVGGQAYLNLSTQWLRAQPPREWTLGSPNLLDLYVDSRPNDRVRAYALVRTGWNPLAVVDSPLGAIDGTAPRVLVDQLWINFDVARTVFVTAGKQHVKWGVGRFWNPTDYLHPVRRDPFATFDARTGATMLKLHVPWEAKGWNFYGIALLDDPTGKGNPANQLGKLAGGARAELVFGPAEFGADALVRQGQRPRFGLDFSAGIWELDVAGELALRSDSDVQLWEEVDPAAAILDRYQKRSLPGVTPQAVVSVSWSANYTDEDVVRVGAEYFYNGPGYDDAHIYPWLMVDPSWFAAEIAAIPPTVPPNVLPGRFLAKTNDFRSFYVGRHYVGGFVLLAAPGALRDHTFTLSAIVNASDGSGVVRVDHSVRVNTWLTVESFLTGNVGNEGGEFRFGLDIPSQTIDLDPTGTLATPAIRTQPPVMSGGVALRVKL